MKNNTQIAISYLIKETKKTVKWKRFSRWVNIYKILATIDYLLKKQQNDKLTEEILLRLYVEIERVQKKFDSSIMPLRAFMIYIRTIQIIVRKEIIHTVSKVD